MVRPRLTLLVLLAVTLAGCGALPGTSQPTPSGPTVTPVPIPSDTARMPTTTASINFATPPGIYANGTVDLETLRNAHEQVIANRSFALTITGERPGENGLEPYRFYSAVADDSSYRERLRTGNFTRMTYSNGTIRYIKEYNVTTEQGTISRGRANITVDAAYHADLMTSNLGEEAEQIDRVTRNGSTYVRVFFVGTPDSDSEALPENTTRYRATAFVRPDGFLDTLVQTYEYRDDGRLREFTLRFRQTGVGNTTVERPEWVQRTRDNGTAIPKGTGTASGTPTGTDGGVGNRTGTATGMEIATPAAGSIGVRPARDKQT